MKKHILFYSKLSLMKIYFSCLLALVSLQSISQINQIEGPDYNTKIKVLNNNSNSKTPTDTIMLNEFNSLFGYPTVLSYSYTNGNGHFFGTNWLNLDQDPLTPYEDGTPSCAQGYEMDSLNPYHIEEILVRVGYKYKSSANGTPLIVSLQKLDGESSYNINTSSGTISYTIKCPGTAISSASIPWDSIKTGVGVNYSVAKLPMPALVDNDYCVVVDFLDFYFTGDKIGLYCSANGGASNIFGKEKTLWLYPNPFMWIQVDHIYTNVDRAIAIFPVIDDGTAGIDNDKFINGIKLGQSFPNPSTDYAQIEYEIAQEENVLFELIDASGKSVLILDEGKKPMGKHTINLNTHEFAKGLYFYRLKTDNYSLTKKILIN